MKGKPAKDVVMFVPVGEAVGPVERVQIQEGARPPNSQYLLAV